ncbi:unnamed protein product [Aphanomyces euteiches]
MKPSALQPESSDFDDDVFTKVLDTLRDKQSSELHSRQVALLNLLVQSHQRTGFKLADLALVEEILTLSCQKLEDDNVDVLVEPVCAIIIHCSKPYIRTKSNEEFTAPHVIQRLLRVLGSFLTSVEPQIQVAAAETLRIFATGTCLSQSTRHDDNADDQRPLPRDYSQQLLESCGIVDAAANALRILLEDQHANSMGASNNSRMDLLLFPVVDLIQEISSWGASAQTLTRKGCLDDILDILDSIDDLRDEFLPVCLEVVWNVLEASEKTTASIDRCASRAVLVDVFRTANAIYALGSLQTFQVLHKLLVRQLKYGYRKQDKELRNTTVMILDILVSKPRNRALFISSGLVSTLLKYATATEVPDAVKNASLAKETHFASACDLDFEFKRLLWTTLVDSARNSAETQRLISDSPLIQVLLLYLGPSDHPGARLWSQAQSHVLRVLALNVLAHLAPHMPSIFLMHDGHIQLVQFVQTSTDEDACATALLLLLQLVPEMQSDVGLVGGVEAMLALFAATHRSCAVRRTALGVCGALCRNHEVNQRRFLNARGVELTGNNLVYEPAHAVTQDNLIVAVVGCIWSSVVGNPESEIRLIQSEGVDNLLDLLELCPAMMRGQVLGLLAELCANAKAIAYFQAWRSRAHYGATQLLLRMYADEEKRLGVERPRDGIVLNLSRPLDVQLIEDAKVEKPSQAAPVVAFVRLKQALVHSKGSRQADPNRRLVVATEKTDLRSKIFAVLASVGFSCVPDDLSYEEQITLAVSKEYPVFRIGDAWLDVKMGLHARGIRPIYADALLIEVELDHVYSIVTHVQCNQQEIHGRRMAALSQDELAFFAGVRRQKEQERPATKTVHISSMQAHLEAKKRKAEMTRKSSMVVSPDNNVVAQGTSTTTVFKDPPPIFNDL